MSSSSSSKTLRQLQVASPVPADIDIANSVEPFHIAEIANNLDLSPDHYDLYGKYKATVLLSVIDELKGSGDGYYVVVGGITPTPLGEGKSTTTVGLCQALGAFQDKKVELGVAVQKACENVTQPLKFLYPLKFSIKEKIEAIAKSYGARGVEYSEQAEKIEMYSKQGFSGLPICMAKTQYSFSHNASEKGAPTGFVLPIRDVRASIGAGFIYPLVGTMSNKEGERELINSSSCSSMIKLFYLLLFFLGVNFLIFDEREKPGTIAYVGLAASISNGTCLVLWLIGKLVRVSIAWFRRKSLEKIYASHEVTPSSCRQCAICLEDFAEGDSCRVLDRCEHKFHFVCLDLWLDYQLTCPICRDSVGSAYDLC